jgi:hypothetical protein
MGDNQSLKAACTCVQRVGGDPIRVESHLRIQSLTTPERRPLEGRFSLRRILSFTRLDMLRCKCVLSLGSLCGVLRLPPESRRRHELVLGPKLAVIT